MNKINKIREAGIIFALIAFTTVFKIWIPVNASQGAVSLGLSEMYILLFFIYFLYLLITKKYILKRFSKIIFTFVIISGFVSSTIAVIHIINGKSIFEFIGVIRNLYTCSIIYFLCDAKKMSKKELLNGLMIFVLLMSISVLYTSVILSLGLNLPNLIYPDSGYIAIAGIAILPYISSILEWTLLRKLAVLLSILFSMTSSLLNGSRASWILSLFVFTSVIIIMFIKKEKTAIRLMLTSLLSSAVLISSFVAFSDSALVRAGIFRASPTISNIVSYYLYYDNQSALWDFNTTDFPDKVTSYSDLLRIISASKGSGMRSNAIRSTAWKAFIKEISVSPLIGGGARFVEIKDPFGNTISVNSHNFLLEIASLFGLIGVIAYVSLLIIIFARLLFYKVLKWEEKLILLLSIGTIFAFAMVQPAISGGITSNIIIWSILAFMLTLYKERKEEKINGGIMWIN